MVKKHRFERRNAPSVRNWQRLQGPAVEQYKSDVTVDCGWGHLIFAHTFGSNEKLARTLQSEQPGRRDIGMYLRDPHVVIAMAPHELFLDPSHTYRLWLDRYQTSDEMPKGFIVRRMLAREDARAINELYAKRQMVQVDPDFLWAKRDSRTLTYLVAEEVGSGQIIGTVTGIDHRVAFNDPENGASLWCLAVDPQTGLPGVGEAMVRFLAEYFLTRGRSFLDLSVMHDNHEAIALYEKLGFVRVPVFALKNKNAFNEPLYIAAEPEEALNPYASIIVREARRRGIAVQVLDEEDNYFSLSLGGRTIVCRESLSELTTAVAMSRCDNKRVTHRLLAEAGLSVPPQQVAGAAAENGRFLSLHTRIVVKPARGEQGTGISVGVATVEEMERAIAEARRQCDTVLLERYVTGLDLRIITIGFEVVAAAVRRPAAIVGTGRHTIRQLIEKQSRRRAAATGGESRIPLDGETERSVRQEGYALNDVLSLNQELEVRKTANLHTGGTIHDVTAQLHPQLRNAAVAAAQALNIPVVGLDFLVPDVRGEEYVIIEANERPGLANHEPQPTAERFIDLLFPQTASRGAHRRGIA